MKHETITANISAIVGEKTAPNGILYYQKVEGWTELASVGW